MRQIGRRHARASLCVKSKVNRQHIGARKKPLTRGLKFEPIGLCALARALTAMGKNPHAKQPCTRSHSRTDAAITENAQGLPAH